MSNKTSQILAFNLSTSFYSKIKNYNAFIFLYLDKEEPDTKFVRNYSNTKDHVVKDEICYCVIDINETCRKVVWWFSINFVKCVKKQSYCRCDVNVRQFFHGWWHTCHRR